MIVFCDFFRPIILTHPKCYTPIRQISFTRDGGTMLAVSDNATIWRWDRVKWTKTVVSELWQNATLRLKPRDVTAELQLQRKQWRNEVVHFTNRTVFTLILIWDVVNKFVFHFWIVHFLSFLSCSFLSSGWRFLREKQRMVWVYQ